MAEASRKANVIISSADADIVTGPVTIDSILYIPGTGSPTATIKASDGTVIWDANSASARIHDSSVGIRDVSLTINMSGTGTKLYLYQKLGRP